MISVRRIFATVLTAIIIAGLLSGCAVSASRYNQDANKAVIYTSYRDVPGVPREVLQAAEELLARRDSFTYAMMVSTETFTDSDGELRGFSALMCRWLTELFGVPFNLQHSTWVDVREGLANGTVDFTGTMTRTPERLETYFMTEAIAQRSVKYFRLEGSQSLDEIKETRLPRYALLEGSVSATNVLRFKTYDFEEVFVTEYDDAYEMLVRGEVDAMLAESSAEAIFDVNRNIRTTPFIPFIYSPVSLTAQNPELEPIILIVQAAMDNNASRHFSNLYEQGHHEYLAHKLHLRFTDEELDYIKNNPVIYFGAEYDNYPASFFNTRSNQWQGITFDVLDKITALTGLEFVVINDNHTEFSELYNMLINGDVPFISELIRSPARESDFLWLDYPFMADSFILISKVTQQNVGMNDVYSKVVGVSNGTAHAEFFNTFYPNHQYLIVFESQETALQALMDDEIDMMMSNYSTLLYLTNYLELPDYKANIIFDESFESGFGFNPNEKVLHSIFNKAMGLIDIRIISEQWMQRRYDYLLSVAQAQRPLLVGVSMLSVCVVILFFALLIRSRTTGKRLEELVIERTDELALQTATLTALFDNIPSHIFAKDLNMVYTQCNKAFLEHFGLKREDVIGRDDIVALGIPEELAEKFRSIDRRVISENKAIVVEEIVPGIDGSRHMYEVTKVPLVLHGDIIGVLGISYNINTLKEKERLAEVASQTKSTFLANMSHEIRTPMNAILGVTEILIQHETLPPAIEEGLIKIYNSCDLLLGIINDILDFSKIEAGKLDIIKSRYNLASLINDSVQLNMMRIDSKPIEFELQIDDAMPAKLIGDELRIKQILNNLLSNAFKYTETGKVTLSVSSQVDETGKNVRLELKVSDTGYGMSEEQQSKLFTEYSRFNEAERLTVEGTGLGLAITQRLVNLMEGGISVESEPDVGSVFTVWLPQQAVDNEILGRRVADSLKRFRSNFLSQKQKAKFNRDPMPYGNVLVVDDIETNLYVAVGLMRLYKLQIDTAMSGQETIERINSGHVYDIIFMDHMMPGMDGIETTKHLRDAGYTEPIVALTANAVAGQADVFLQNGFDDFISKPIDIRQLNTILNRLVRDKQPQHIVDAARMKVTASDVNEPDGDNSQNKTLLMESFIRDAQRALEVLNEISDKNVYDKEGSLQRYITVVHGMKSSLRNIGAQQLGEVAATLEMCGREKAISLIKEQTPEFIKDLQNLLEGLKNEMTSSAQGNTNDLTDKLLKVNELCAIYNRKGVLEILAEIRHYSDEAKKLADTLEEYIHAGDFEAAEEASKQMVKDAGTELVTFKDKQLDGLDITQGLDRYNADEKTYKKVLNSYAVSISVMLDTIESLNVSDSLNADDLKIYEITVHGIKGASYDIFAGEVGKKAEELEHAAKAVNMSLIVEKTPVFVEAARELIASIKKMISSLSSETSKPKKEKPDDGVLAKLIEACKTYDLSEAEAAMAEIEKYSYESDDDLGQWLRGKIDLMRYTDIIERLTENN